MKYILSIDNPKYKTHYSKIRIDDNQRKFFCENLEEAIDKIKKLESLDMIVFDPRIENKNLNSLNFMERIRTKFGDVPSIAYTRSLEYERIKTKCEEINFHMVVFKSDKGPRTLEREANNLFFHQKFYSNRPHFIRTNNFNNREKNNDPRKKLSQWSYGIYN